MNDPLLAIVRVLRAEIGDVLRTRDTGAAVTASKIAQRSLKGASERSPGRPTHACARGCSFCCHNAVSVSAPEAFRLADALRRLPDAERTGIETTLRARAAEVAALTLPEQALRRTPCALLASDGACTLHAARPLPCISMTSFDRGACERAFHSPDGKARIPVDAALFRWGGAHNLALRLACRDAGLEDVRYELHDALVTVLDHPEAETRWLAGEDPFAACRRDRTSEADTALKAIDELTRS
jgi:uncharacterized membrane protein